MRSMTDLEIDKIFKERVKNLSTTASLFILNKSEALSDFDKKKFDSLEKLYFQDQIIKAEISNINRKHEFILGRYCAHEAYSNIFGKELTILLKGSDRSPIWPTEAVGSISHDSDWAIAAVAKSSKLSGVGLDIERLDRIKNKISHYICSEREQFLRTKTLSQTEFLTLIFSAKEAFYKALYPQTKVFFGFQDAAIKEIDEVQKIFKIELLRDLNSLEGKSILRSEFVGRFAILDGHLITLIETAI